MKQIFHIRSVRFYLGCFLALAAFAVIFFAYNKLSVGLGFAIMFLVIGMVKIPDAILSRRTLVTIYAIWFVVTAFVTLALSQFCLNEVLPEKGGIATVMGTLLVASLFLFPFIITLKIRITIIVVSAILVIFTCINYFVFLFRGSEIAPADILAITTAGNVAAEYSFQIPAVMCYALTMCAIYYFTAYAFPPLVVNKKKRVRIFSGIIAIACACIVWFGGIRIKPLHWLQTGSVMNGYLFNFVMLLRDSFPNKPDDYSEDKVNAIGTQLVRPALMEESPDIIVIMDESYADLDVLGNKLNTDVEVSSFVNNLKEDTLSGYTLSSVFGGGTPNSEFEFLTGNSLLFLPTGSIAYQQFINKPCYSIVWDLRSRGYSTFALHQYLPNSWMRERIWPLLGFENCLFLDDFPQKEMLRNWGTDQEMFEKLTLVYEEQKVSSDSPVFMFAVTIQNHGGYEYAEDDFTSTVHLQGYAQSYPEVEQYLTCIQETDKAVEWLIRYFEQVDRKVVILFYGDHFPRLSDAFFEELHGGPIETLDDRMLQYKVPFFIWTNYPSDSEELELVSMNYLAGLLYQRAELVLPPYSQYLENVRQIIPACNSFGYYSSSLGGFLSLEDAQGNEQRTLLEYNYLEWNCLFDTDNRNEILFPIQKYFKYE